MPAVELKLAQPCSQILRRGLRQIVLTGFMGAGKSTVGGMLAASLGCCFFDLDALIEQRMGMTVPEIFEREGEQRFRRIESSALAAALRTSGSVLALGGGAPETLTNRLLLEQTPGIFTIFLDASFATLFDRCVLQDMRRTEVSRPVMADPVAAEARFATRLPLYRRLARLTVETSGSEPREVVERILHELHA